VAKVQSALKSARKALSVGVVTPPAKPPTESQLRLTRAGTTDGRGLEVLRLELMENGKATSTLYVVSGAPGAQRFRLGKDSRAGSLEPLPQGRYRIQDIAWAAGKDNYSGNWGPGLGPASVPLTYLGPGTTQRSAIEIHYDANHGSSPGTAGCVGVNSIADLKNLVGWLRRVDPKGLVVDWGIKG
jgi:lysozyme